MRIGQRLTLAVSPGIVGMLAVAALAYWGEFGRQIPVLLLIIIAVVSVLSFLVAWSTTRDIARRIERLGRLADARSNRGPSQEPRLLVALIREAVGRISGTAKTRSDELDSIERIVAKIDAEFAVLAAKDSAADERIAHAKRETATLLQESGARIANRIDEVRMPLHVLLATPFGELNENQEELVGVARAAADEASAEAHRLRDLGTLELSTGARRDRFAAGDLLRSLQPVLEAEGRKSQARLELDIAPGLPALVGDRAQLQEAIRELIAKVLGSVRRDAAASVRVVASSADGAVELSISPAGDVSLSNTARERRLLEALGASVEMQEGEIVLRLPVWR